MACSKLYLQAIKALPERYVQDGTVVAEFAEHGVVATNPEQKPLIYRQDTGRWEVLEFVDDKGKEFHF